MTYFYNGKKIHTIMSGVFRFAVVLGVVLVLQGCVTTQEASVGQGFHETSSGEKSTGKVTLFTRYYHWNIQARHDISSGQFDSCFGSFVNTEKAFVGILLDRHLNFSISIYNPHWKFTPNEEYVASYALKHGHMYSDHWRAFNEGGIYKSWGHNEHSKYILIRDAEFLNVTVKRITTRVELDHVPGLLRGLENCVKKYNATTEAASANSPVFEKDSASRNPFKFETTTGSKGLPERFFRGWTILTTLEGETGEFESCIGAFTSSDGTSFSILMAPGRVYGIGMDNPEWTFSPSRKYDVVYAIDSGEAISDRWQAFDYNGLYRIWNDHGSAHFNRLRNARALKVSIGAIRSNMRLDDMNDLFQELENCVAKYSSETDTASANPFAPNSETASANSTSGGQTSDEGATAQYWAQRMNGFADDILEHANLPDTTRMPLSELPRGFEYIEAAWKGPGVIGGVYHKMGAISPYVGSTMVSSLSEACDGKSASRTERRFLPNDGVVHRIVSKCKEAEPYTVIVTLYPLTDKNAFYVMFHRSFTPGRAEAMDERIYATISDGIDHQMMATE